MLPRKYLKLVFVKELKHLENYLEVIAAVKAMNVCVGESGDQPETTEIER